MNPLDDREQRYSVLAAAMGAIVSVALWAPSFGERAGILLALIGVVMSGLLYAAARRRSRLFTGVAAVLLAFGPWGFAWLIGLPFLILAGWLVVRAPRPGIPQPGDDDRPEPAPSRPSRRRRKAPKPAPETPRPPRASKRYTPPQRRP